MAAQQPRPYIQTVTEQHTVITSKSQEWLMSVAHAGLSVPAAEINGMTVFHQQH